MTFLSCAPTAAPMVSFLRVTPQHVHPSALIFLRGHLSHRITSHISASSNPIGYTSLLAVSLIWPEHTTIDLELN